MECVQLNTRGGKGKERATIKNLMWTQQYRKSTNPVIEDIGDHEIQTKTSAVNISTSPHLTPALQSSSHSILSISTTWDTRVQCSKPTQPPKDDLYHTPWPGGQKLKNRKQHYPRNTKHTKDHRPHLPRHAQFRNKWFSIPSDFYTGNTTPRFLKLFWL